jgi:hypothetical protein
MSACVKREPQISQMTQIKAKLYLWVALDKPESLPGLLIFPAHWRLLQL